MNQDLLWRRIHGNEQAVAEREKLVRPGENYRLTGDQDRALATLDGWYGTGVRAGLLHAPTGSGKTAVEFRLAIAEFLRRRAPVLVLVPTRDLVRQHMAYFQSRLAGTPLQVAELHGGVAPRDRTAIVQRIESGVLAFVIGSGLLLKEEGYRQIVRAAGFLIVDDVHALDPVEHLRPLRGIHTPALYATATPAAVEEFLAFKEAPAHTVSLEMTPFETPDTRIELLRARFKEDPMRQVMLAEAAIRRHLDNDGRVYVVSRTRADVPRLTHLLERQFNVPVTMLHGDMVDTREQAQRLQRFKSYQPDKTRVAMMERFKETLPAILVGTNLIGAGLDVPAADLIVITDADGFGPAELEQLIGRVGRRERPSEAYLVQGTLTQKTKRRR